MLLYLEATHESLASDELLVVRLVAYNEDYIPVALDRRLLIGPNLMPGPGLKPQPVNVEPAFENEADNIIQLNPWTSYGRQRQFQGQPAGEVMFYGYLVREFTTQLLPSRPGNEEDLLIQAEPLVLVIGE
jgi:hypothetical protein